MTFLTFFKKNSLAFRLLKPITTLMIAIGLIFSIAIFTIFNQFAHSQIEESKHSFEEEILSILNNSYTELVESGKVAVPASGFIQKAKTAALIETFFNSKKLHGRISEGDEVIYKIENNAHPSHNSPEKHTLLFRLNSFIFHVDYSASLSFKPWDWQVTFVQDDSDYHEVMQKATYIFVSLAILILAANVMLLVIMGKVIGRPLRNIIDPVRQGEMPAYTGTNEFEFLSKTICNDMTRRLKVENELLDQKKFLERATEDALAASKAKSEFLANISHEIRTPMNAIVGFTDMALATDLTDKQHEFILAINHASDTLLGLINDILDFSKIEAGKLDIDHLEFNLQEMISRLASINQGRIKEKDLEFVQIVPPMDRMLIGDPARIQQILTNLIGNAVKFTSQGTITLEVRMREQTEETITLDFAVSDTGIGIAEGKQTAIFDAFTQADGSVTRDFGGTGLGLTIANKLVGLLGDTTLDVSSLEGEGSTFSFELSFRLGGKVGAEPDRAEKEEKPPEKIKACRILLVEDDMINAKVATMLLEEHGHMVTIAANGRLGVEAAFNDEFDIILMDIMMPEMDGLTATREIRRREKESGPYKRHLPIVAWTGKAMKGDKEKCIEAGMDYYLTKPIKIKIINQVISQCLADRKKERQGSRNLPS